ncbi:hypothetical protein BJV74DRAFT_531505 [Russula compacta]|nr:hypothetical protein BJV74DRAFT_531505 [Russula compacta]
MYHTYTALFSFPCCAFLKYNYCLIVALSIHNSANCPHSSPSTNVAEATPPKEISQICRTKLLREDDKHTMRQFKVEGTYTRLALRHLPTLIFIGLGIWCRNQVECFPRSSSLPQMRELAQRSA